MTEVNSDCAYLLAFIFVRFQIHVSLLDQTVQMTKNLSIETEKLSESSISDGVRRRVTSDLQSMAVSVHAS